MKGKIGTTWQRRIPVLSIGPENLNCFVQRTNLALKWEMQGRFSVSYGHDRRSRSESMHSWAIQKNQKSVLKYYQTQLHN